MPKATNTTVQIDLRKRVFDKLQIPAEFVKIDDKKYGILLTDLNGVERYVRLGAIVAEERNDMTARELMESEIKLYNDAQEQKARKAQENAKKAAADKAKREAKTKAKEAE